jgi:hypothetical protein
MSQNLRELLNGPAGYAVAGAVLLLAVIYTLFASGPEEPQREFTLGAFYLDTATGKLFVAPPDSYPPVKAPTGGVTGVKAIFYSCGTCDDPKQRFLGYVTRYTDEAKAKLTAGTNLNFDERDKLMVEGLEKSAEGKEWVLAVSKEGRAFEAKAIERCKGGKLVECRPLPAEARTGEVLN